MTFDIKDIATLPFNGDTRKGPRHSFLVSELLRHGCQPVVDRHANIWVESGDASEGTIVVSSHIDVDSRIRDLSFSSYREGGRRMVKGVMDNAVGCYLNLSLAASRPRKGRIIHIFTASEEIERDNPRRFCRSAREVVRELKSNAIIPDFVAVLDVTFPRLLDPHGKISWSKPYPEIFDVEDRMHCYIDGYSRRKEKELASLLLRRSKDPYIGLRYLHGHDEAFVYGRFCPAFAFGPVVFGDFSAPGQTMAVANLETSLRFLRKTLGYS